MVIFYIQALSFNIHLGLSVTLIRCRLSATLRHKTKHYDRNHLLGKDFRFLEKIRVNKKQGKISYVDFFNLKFLAGFINSEYTTKVVSEAFPAELTLTDGSVGFELDGTKK